MATVAVLGGGISGLTCAYYLKKLAKSRLKYLFLLEKNPKFGGWIQTTKYPDGAICEHGPRTIRVGGAPGYNALALAEEVGLKDQVLPINRDHPAAKNRLILYKNELKPLPSGVKYLFRALPPLNQSILSIIFKDLRSPKQEYSDMSLHEFGLRRFGKNAADYLLDPLCRGIVAADAKETSLRSVFPTMYQHEQKHGSVIKGHIKELRQGAKLTMDMDQYMNSNLAFIARKDFWRMWSLKNGLSDLVDGLACSIEENGKADLHVNATCEALTFVDDKVLVKVDGEDIEVDHVFSALPSMNLAKLLPQQGKLSKLLASIPSVTVAIVYLEYLGFAHQLEAFGFLTPSCEDSNVLGITFDSCCFPGHNGEARTRITCMMGGQWFSKIFGDDMAVSEEQVLELALDAAEKHLKISTKPCRHYVAIQRDCIPRYLVNHHQKIEDIHTEVENYGLMKSLTLLGAWHGSASVPDCIYQAKQCVENYLSLDLAK